MTLAQYSGRQANAAGNGVWARVVRGPGNTQSFVGPVDATMIALVADTIALGADYRAAVSVGGLQSASNTTTFTTFINDIISDGGAAWTTEVQDKLEAFFAIEGAVDQIIMEVGNELNSERWSTAVITYESGDPGDIKGNDTAIIPYYVEYYLAPVLAARIAAATTLGISKTDIRVLPGTYSNYASVNSRTFMDLVYAYEIVGTYAAGLAGVVVGDEINDIAWHYLATNTTYSGADAIIDNRRSTYPGFGIWATEEIGQVNGDNEAGASMAIRVSSIYTQYVIENSIPTSDFAWCLYAPNLGDITGTKGDEAMTWWLDLFDNTLPSVATPVSFSGTNISAQFFTRYDGKTIAVVYATNPASAAELASLDLDGPKTLWAQTGYITNQAELDYPITIDRGALIIQEAGEIPSSGLGMAAIQMGANQ